MSMLPFTYVNATTVAEASAALAAGNAELIAGGTDLLGRLKDNILPTYPTTIINIMTIPNMNYITQSNSGLKIGALATIDSIANSSVVSATWPALSTAASMVSGPHQRKMGTIGGNLAQKVRCWYYRVPNNRFYTLRKGGTTCFAASGDNRYNSIFGAPSGCFAVYASDTATALMALNASIVTNTRTIGIEDFFDPLAGTVLGTGELITEVDIPTPPAGSTQTFSKFRLRKSIDFAILNVATMVTLSGTTCTAARIGLGGVAPTPLRSTAAENAIVGQTLNATTAAAAGAAAVASATPLRYNAYKVPILKTLVARALVPPPTVTIPLPTPIKLGSITFTSPSPAAPLSGTQGYTISGTISPTPSLPDSVSITVQLQGIGASGSPEATLSVVDTSTQPVSASGTFSYTTKVGGSSGWVPGYYVISASDSNGAYGNVIFEYST